MPAPFQPQIVTANMLIDGEVAYLTADNQWSKRLAEAEILTDVEQAAERLSFGETFPNETVGVYLIAVAVHENRPTPAHFREEFRATGPSNYHHGKQEAAHV